MQVVVWVIIGIVAAAILAGLIWFIVKISKMSPEDRKDAIRDFLSAIIEASIDIYVQNGIGEEQVKKLEEEFKKTAPWFLKILLSVTSSANLDELIEEALQKAQDKINKDNN